MNFVGNISLEILGHCVVFDGQLGDDRCVLLGPYSRTSYDIS